MGEAFYLNEACPSRELHSLLGCWGSSCVSLIKREVGPSYTHTMQCIPKFKKGGALPVVNAALLYIWGRNFNFNALLVVPSCVSPASHKQTRSHLVPI